ncbi:MAG: T9SS type A sorting domain-containing protein [Sphingobacteriales bacterium]|nr:MAG: T9SS type A sorting domain-containing protein [Sphingobacteriales bacterium]
MFKKFILVLTVLLLSKFAGFAQAPGFNSLNAFTDSCYNNVGANTILTSVSVNNPNAGTSVAMYWGDGTSDLVNSTVNGNFNATHNYTSVGVYTVAGVLFDGATPVDTIYQTVNSFCSSVQGVGYKRADNNCSLNSATESILNTPFSIEVRKAGVPVDTIQSSGFIYKRINSADLTSVFTLHVLSAPNGMLQACPTAAYTFKFDTLDYATFEGFNFGFDCDPAATGFDLSVTGFGFFRTMANSYIHIYPRNSACTGTNGVVTLNLSPKYSFVSANITPASVSGNTITWNVNNISNTSADQIYVNLNAVGTPALGDTVMNTVSIAPVTGDVNPSNNTYPMVDSIRASFDPNEKHVYPIGDIAQGELLTYTIHFENLGNDTAFNIHILDTLSAHVDPATFKVITGSHPVSAQMIANGAMNTLRFDFANILLADASAPNENKGFVTYQINAKTGLAAGTEIDNTAHIYFDINPAVVTNTAKNRIPTELSIRKTEGQKAINVYPNPANDKLFVEGLSTFKNVTIVNSLGQAVAQPKANKSYLSIDQLAPGIYFLKATGKDGLYTQKFIKQ